MLHVLSGDAALPAFRAAGLPGKPLVWREMLAEGPARQGLATPADWEHRAQWIEAHYGIPAPAAFGEAAKALALLEGVAPAEEVVLWFEPDLFGAVNLLGAVQACPAGTRFLLPGLAGPLPSRFEARREVGPEALQFALAAWRAYAGPEPPALERLLREHGDTWPGLAAPLRLHLPRFPAVRDGLGAAERAALEALDAPQRFRELFAQFRNRTPGLGWGDWQVGVLLLALAREEPLVALDGGPTKLPRDGSLLDWRAARTPAGDACLEGRADRTDFQRFAAWLGGAPLRGEPRWRWDAEAARLVEALPRD